MLHSHLSAQRAQCQRQSGARIVLTAVLASGIDWCRSQLRPQGTKSGPRWSLKYGVGLVGALALSFVQLSAAESPYNPNISSPSGLKAGGKTFTRTGEGSLPNTPAIIIGGITATQFTVISSSGITAIAPAGSLGANNVVVTNFAGTRTHGPALEFNYISGTFVKPAAPFRPAFSRALSSIAL